MVLAIHNLFPRKKGVFQIRFFRMENGNYEQKYQESNILKNQDRY